MSGVARQEVMLVEKVMTRRPPRCLISQSLVAAARIMYQSRVLGIPVFDVDHRLVGVLSVDDLVEWEARRNNSRGWLRTMDGPTLVAHAMTHDVMAVSPSESIAEVARVMRLVSRSVLPVVDSDGSLVGIVSSTGIASASARSDGSIQRDVRQRLTRVDATIPSGTINVYVEAGVVTLTGAIESRAETRTLRRSVATVAGVIGIRTQMAEPVRAMFNFAGRRGSKASQRDE